MSNVLTERDKVSKKEMLSYGMGSLGNNIIYAFIATYLLKFYTDYFGLAAAAVGVLFFVARLWDAINDPIMGIIVDNTNTRWGRFRPYLLFVPFIMGITTIACFIQPELSSSGKLIYAYITYILWGMSFTAMDIPYWSMSAAITQDPRERDKVVMVPRSLAGVGFLIVNLFTLPLVSKLDGLGHGTNIPIISKIGGWGFVAIIYSIIAIILTLITFFNVKEKVSPQRKERQTIKKVINLLINNRPLMMLIISMMILEGINVLKTGFALYYLQYNLNAESMIPIFLGVYLIISIIGSILSPFITKKVGKKNTAFYGILIFSISTIGMFFTGYGSLGPIFIWSGISAFCWGATNIAQMSMLVDCVEYGEWKTGNRAEGMVFSTNIFKTKVASAIGGAIAAFSLDIIGYQPNTAQTISTLNSMHFIFTILAGALTLFALIPLKFYNLSEARYLEILDEISKKKEGGVQWDDKML